MTDLIGYSQTISALARHGQHSPCEYFAAAGYDAIAAKAPSVPDDDPIHAREARRMDGQVLLRLKGDEPPKKRRPKKDAPPIDPNEKEAAVPLAGHWIDWPKALPELKIWAGGATVQTLIEGRLTALWTAGDLPEGVRLTDWRLPYGTMSGLDPRTAASTLDIGFSPAVTGMDIMTFIAGELLAIIGMQIAPITRFAKREYGYQIDGQWFVFGVEQREGYHRMLTMSRPRR